MPGHVGGEPVPAHELVLSNEFWSLIEMGDDVQKDCWIWKGLPYGKSGYGRWNQHNWGYWVHRVTFAQYRGEIPPGLVIDHLCMNKICCNPYHLDPTTTQDNIRRWSEQTIPTCKRGHPKTKANTASGTNRCKICHRLDERERVKRMRAEGRTARTGKMGRPINQKTRLGWMIHRSGLRTDQVSALSGVYRTALAKYIHDGNIPVRHLVPLCELFQCEPEDILGTRQAPQPGRDRDRDSGPTRHPGDGDRTVRHEPTGLSPERSGLQDRLRQGDARSGNQPIPPDSRPQRGESDRQHQRPTEGPEDQRSDR